MIYTHLHLLIYRIQISAESVDRNQRIPEVELSVAPQIYMCSVGGSL